MDTQSRGEREEDAQRWCAHQGSLERREGEVDDGDVQLLEKRKSTAPVVEEEDEVVPCSSGSRFHVAEEDEDEGELLSTSSRCSELHGGDGVLSSGYFRWGSREEEKGTGRRGRRRRQKRERRKG